MHVMLDGVEGLLARVCVHQHVEKQYFVVVGEHGVLFCQEPV